ncbi:hypothetical protein [Conservatibacter flavescens]|uniref:Uncharacterized protein n=1 Tax=Conservatibacter flavescens TaxID=28161 RepID=A0A2M8S4Y0_9PAST|nr:hypothetical protein [Conservatibacter flavescens]PJG86197.1 hypothetical protein CVP05_03230 [Conservatibacter flavescens]
MKKLFASLVLMLPAIGYAATEKAQQELEKAMLGDYQSLRNVAYSMKEGTFGHDKNPVSACALRKVILFVNKDEIDTTDYSNEYVDCKNLSMQEHKKSWEIALQAIQIISKYK